MRDFTVQVIRVSGNFLDSMKGMQINSSENGIC